MKNKQIKQMVDAVEDYVDHANVDEITGRIFSLAVKVEKDMDVEAGIELALITAFLEEKEK